ncbi:MULTISPECIES: GNAT family N-acetyltransferase [unclassified Saccharicrinis]|uniref:GNAT family N-acetyltransferase n=1 Tax=unclassified Saccharicrinis TaxID=2646859 RepID=UPI003D357FF8
MHIKIKEVINLKDLKSFVQFPEWLYRNNPYRVPPLFVNEYSILNRDKNPAFEHCEAKYWLAYDRDQVVGRVAAIINHAHIKKWNQRYLRFGWIDFIDDKAVFLALMEKVEQWALQEGLEAVHGPLGFTDHDPVGMLVEGFDEISTQAATYNYPYYTNHFEKAGYTKDTDWVEYEIEIPDVTNEKIERIANMAMQRYGLKLLAVNNKKELLPYASDLFQLIEDSHQHLYGVVPLTKKQIQKYIEQYYDIIIPEFLPVVMDRNNRVIAFGFAIPFIGKALQKAKGKLYPLGFMYLFKALKKNDRAELCLIAVKPEYQRKGVNAILIHNMVQVFNSKGILKVESNPELESNKLVQGQWKYFDKRQHKRRRCYIKHLKV